MTHALLMKALAASAILAASLTIPQTVYSTDPVMEYPAAMAAATSSPKVVVRKTETRKVPGDCTMYSDIIGKYDWPVTVAMRICRDESGGDTNAKNWGDKHYDLNGDLICVSSQGLMQIGCIHPIALGYTTEDLLVPEKNIAMAYELWKVAGWCPWVTYKGVECG